MAVWDTGIPENVPLDRIGLTFYSGGQEILVTPTVDGATLQREDTPDGLGVFLLWTPTVQDWQAIFATLGDNLLYLDVVAHGSDSSAPASGSVDYIGNRYGFTVDASR